MSALLIAMAETEIGIVSPCVRFTWVCSGEDNTITGKATTQYLPEAQYIDVPLFTLAILFIIQKFILKAQITMPEKACDKAQRLSNSMHASVKCAIK